MLRWLVLALVGSRLLVLTAGIDAVYFDEELSTGLIGVHLIDGLRLPFFDYQIAPHLGGTLLIGALSAPFFLLFGEHLFALKLVPLLLHVGAMVLWYRCCDRYFGRPAAILTALLFIVPPQLLTRFSLVAVGFHPESLLFTAAAAWLLFRITSRSDSPMWSYVALGFIWGLGTWFAYIFVPTILTSVLYWTLVDRRWMARHTTFAIVLGSVLGLMPWLIYNTTHQWSGLAWIGGSGLRESLDLWTRLEAAARFLTVDLFRSFGAARETPQRPRPVFFHGPCELRDRRPLRGPHRSNGESTRVAGALPACARGDVRRKPRHRPRTWPRRP
jgi:4-amino-4-deoxy-L-arabinose transferase-like glycosyltransferase